MLRRIGLALGLVALVSSASMAQVVETRTTTTTPESKTTEIRRVSQLIGSNVQLQGGNNYGKVADVVLDNNGGIGYLVVERNNQYALMPWNAANVNYGQRAVTFDVTPQAVQPLFFAQNAWPTITDQQFTNRMQQVFPNARTVRREVLRPVQGTLPPTGGAIIKEKTRIKPNGEVKVKEKVK